MSPGGYNRNYCRGILPSLSGRYILLKDNGSIMSMHKRQTPYFVSHHWSSLLCIYATRSSCCNLPKWHGTKSVVPVVAARETTQSLLMLEIKQFMQNQCQYFFIVFIYMYFLVDFWSSENSARLSIQMKAWTTNYLYIFTIFVCIWILYIWLVPQGPAKEIIFILNSDYASA